MRKIKINLTVVFVLCISYVGVAQKWELGIGLASLQETNWSKPMSNAPDLTAVNVVASPSCKIGLHLQYKMNEKVFLVSKPSLIWRHLDIQERHSSVSGMQNYTLELPFGIAYKKSLNETSALVSSCDIGYSYMMGNFERFTMFDPKIHIVMDDENSGAPFARIGLGVENTWSSFGRLQLNVAFTYHFAEQLRYRYQWANTDIVESVTQKQALHYLSFGLVYYPKFLQSK